MRDKLLSWAAVLIIVGCFLWWALKPTWCFWPWDCF